MAGWKEKQIISGTKGIVNLAAAGNEDLGRTSDVVTDLMTAYQLRAGANIKFNGKPIQEASAFFADSMAALITSANTDINQAYEAMKYSAPAISAMYADRSIEEKAQAMQDAFIITGLMASSGVKASQAGTSQRALFTRLASENRNAYFAERALPVSLVDETTGEVRRLRDVVSDFREKFQNGLDVDEVTRFAEEISGEKIHADTRRKLNSFIENVQKNGGKMTGADKLKLTSMLSGQEAMSGWLSVFLASEEDFNKLAAAIDNAQGKAAEMAAIQLDNLAGDVTMLGSAWDAFQRNLVKGSASEGLRDFTQGMTDVLTNANKLFKDGIQFADFGKIGIDIIDRLKDKFIQLDGIGSMLAGGALFMGLKKILSMALNVKDTLTNWAKVKSVNDVGNILRGNQGAIGTSQVGTMHVNAGVVNLNGAIKGGVPSTNQRIPATTGGITATNQRGTTLATAGAATAGSILVSSRGGRNITTYNPAIRQQEIIARNNAYVEDYYNRRANYVPPTQPSTIRANASAIGGAGILAGVFGAIDIFSARSHSEQTMTEARETVAYQKNVLAELKAQGESQEVIMAQVQAVQDAEAFVERTRIMNANVERQAEVGAAGAVTGALAGAALGSFVPVIGTAIGGMIGGILGQLGGVKVAEYAAEQQGKRREQIQTEQPAGSISDFRRTENLEQTEEYKKQQSEIAAQRNENVLVQNAAGISRRQTADRLESLGINPNEIPTVEALQRHKISDKNTAAERYANFQYEQEMARGEFLAGQREKYNREWQQRFGGTSLGGQANFVPDNERDREILKRYDEVQANKARQQDLMANLEAKVGNGGATGEFKPTNILGDVKKNVVQSEANKQSIEAIKNFFDGLLFNKAAASSITPETNRELSTAENSPIKPQLDSGFFNFELPNISEMFSGVELPNIGELFNFEIPDIGTKVSEMFSGVELPNIGELFNFDFDIGTNISEMFSGVELPNIAELFNFEIPDLGIAEKLSMEFEAASFAFENFTAMAISTFSGLAGSISGALAGVGSAITTVFSSAASEVQGIWNAMPGFFSGVFAGLGGAASAAGSAIYSGLTSVIGGIIGAWQSAAATISGIISSIGAMASSAAGAVGSFVGIGSNATGTASWRGGWTEINEHGGEIINLPKGTQIIPHATTVNILRKEINRRIDNGETNYHGLNFADYGLTNNILAGDVLTPKIQPARQTGRRQNSVSNSPIENIFTSIFGWTPRQATFKNLPNLGGLFDIFSGTNERSGLSGDIITTLPNLPNIGNSGLSGDIITTLPNLPNISVPKFEMPKIESGSSSSSSTNHFNFGDVNINNGTDFDEFVYKLQTLLGHSAANSTLI